MGGLLSTLPVVYRRVAANWKLLSAVVVGAVLAAAIMSTTSIYTDAIRDLGLSYAIRQRGPDQINILVRSTSQNSAGDVYAKNTDYIQSQARRDFGSLIDGDITSISRSSTFYPTAPGGTVDPADSRPRSHLQFVTGIEPHINIVAGRMPNDTAAATPDAPPTIEAAVGSDTAKSMGVSVGSEYDLHPFWVEGGQPVHVKIVGIIEPKDQSEPFWLGQTDLFTFPTSNWQTMPLFITKNTFFDAIVGYLPTMTSDFTNLIYLDTSGVDARNADRVQGALNGYGSDLQSNVIRTTITTALPTVLATYDQKLFFTRIPLLVLVLQIAAIVLYYLYMVSTMLVERQAAEIALLKSRGATTWQVMRIYMLEGLVILIAALVLGPPIAAGVISLLGHTPPFHDLSAGSSLRVHLGRDAYLWAAGGAFLAYVTLLFPAYQATRRTVVQQRAASARPPKEPVFTRYYLDLALAVLGGILLYQLNRRGTLVNHKFFGDQSVDPVVLLTPAFFILTVGLVFLRLFPLVLKLLAWVVARAQGASILIGMWQLVRNPVHYSRLVLLLMLATAVGMFAASFGATLNRSYADRASYQAGSDVRFSDVRTVNSAGPNDAPTAVSQDVDGQQVSQVYRLEGSEGPLISRVSLDVLGVDPQSFPSVSYFRGDFASSSLQSLVAKLGPPVQPQDYGLQLPADAHWLGIWVNPVDMRSTFGIEMEMRDATGRYFDYPVGPADLVQMQPGWNLVVADLTRPLNTTTTFSRTPVTGPRPNGPYNTADPQGPLTVTSITLRAPARLGAPQGVIQFSDLQTTNQASIGDQLQKDLMRFDPQRAQGNLPGAQVVESFDSTNGWQSIQGVLPTPLNDQTRIVDVNGTKALELRWTPQQGQVLTHGVQAAGVATPIPALASDGFLHHSGLRIGDTAQLFVNSAFFNVKIVGSYNLFATLNASNSADTMVMDGAKLAAVINANPRGPLTYPSEYWIKGSPDSVTKATAAISAGTVTGNLTSFAALRDAQQKDPLVAAGWEGILFISFAAILILSAIGFLIYSYLTAQRRTLEFAVLRTMGFSKRQIATVVGFEQCFVIGLGMLAGTLMGMRLGSLMIRYMGLTETGDQVVPPMELHISWLTIGGAWLILASVFLVTISAVVLLYSRLALHRVLRIGEA